MSAMESLPETLSLPLSPSLARAPQKRVILTMGGKGGVGKTSFLLSVAEWLETNEVPFQLLDLDIENKARGSLKHYFHGAAEKVNIHTPSGLDAFLDYLDKGPPIILADMGAGSGQVAHEWFDTMYESAQELGIAFTAIGIVTPDPASVESVLSWARELQHKVQYLIVERNREAGRLRVLAEQRTGRAVPACVSTRNGDDEIPLAGSGKPGAATRSHAGASGGTQHPCSGIREGVTRGACAELPTAVIPGTREGEGAILTVSSTQLELNGAPGVSPHWVDQVAELLPEERRLAWYRDLSPWLRGLPAEDEFGRIAYAMGFLALLVRDTPPLLTDEREKFAKLLQQLDREMGGAVKTTATYHQQLQECLNKLPGEIAKGVSPQALAAQMVEGLRQQFHQSGMPEIGTQLREQVKDLKTLAKTQSDALADLKSKVESTTQKAQQGIDTLDRKAAAAVRESERVVANWNKTTSKTMLMLQILTLLIAFVLGVAACWNFFPRTIIQQITVPALTPAYPAPKTQPPLAKKPAKRTHANSQQTQPK